MKNEWTLSTLSRTQYKTKRALDAENHKQNGMQADTKFLFWEEYLEQDSSE